MTESLHELLVRHARGPRRPADLPGIRARARTRRARRRGATAFAAVAVVALTGWGVLRLADRPAAVMFDQPSTPTADASSTGAEVTEMSAGPPVSMPPPATASAWCGAEWLVGVIIDTAGAPSAMCADGATAAIASAGVHRNAAIGPAELVMEVRDAPEGVPQLVALDLSTGETRLLGPGAAPAQTSAGRFAWLGSDPSTGEPMLMVADDVGSEPAVTIPLAENPGVTGLSWDRGGRWLVVSGESDSGVVRFEAIDVTASAAEPVALAPGETVLAAAGETDTPDAAVLLTESDGDQRLRLFGALLDQPGAATTQYGAVDSAPAIPDPATGIAFDLSGAATVEPIGLATRDPATGRWSRGTSIAWLIGDGRSLWLVALGVGHQVAGDAADVAINRSYSLALAAAATATAPESDAGVTSAPAESDSGSVPVVWTRASRGDGDALDAIVTGRIEYDAQHDCFLLDDIPVVWPYGTRPAAGDPPGVQLPNGVTARVGQSVRGGGGYHEPDHVAEVDNVIIPDACLGPTREVASFNPVDAVEVTG